MHVELERPTALQQEIADMALSIPIQVDAVIGWVQEYFDGLIRSVESDPIAGQIDHLRTRCESVCDNLGSVCRALNGKSIAQLRISEMLAYEPLLKETLQNLVRVAVHSAFARTAADEDDETMLQLHTQVSCALVCKEIGLEFDPYLV